MEPVFPRDHRSSSQILLPCIWFWAGREHGVRVQGREERLAHHYCCPWLSPALCRVWLKWTEIALELPVCSCPWVSWRQQQCRVGGKEAGKEREVLPSTSGKAEGNSYLLWGLKKYPQLLLPLYQLKGRCICTPPTGSTLILCNWLLNSNDYYCSLNGWWLTFLERIWWIYENIPMDVEEGCARNLLFLLLCTRSSQSGSPCRMMPERTMKQSPTFIFPITTLAAPCFGLSQC